MAAVSVKLSNAEENQTIAVSNKKTYLVVDARTLASITDYHLIATSDLPL